MPACVPAPSPSLESSLRSELASEAPASGLRVVVGPATCLEVDGEGGMVLD